MRGSRARAAGGPLIDKVQLVQEMKLVLAGVKLQDLAPEEVAAGLASGAIVTAVMHLARAVEKRLQTIEELLP